MQKFLDIQKTVVETTGGNRWKSNYNADLFPRVDEKTFRPSLTVPNQALSIQEIMRRYAQGLSVDGVKVPVYNGEEEEDINLAKLDLAERQELIEQNILRIAELRDKAREERKKSYTRYKEQALPFPSNQNKPDESNSNNQNNPPNPAKGSEPGNQPNQDKKDKNAS